MSRHLFHPQHLPHPHLADRVAAMAEHVLEIVHGERWHEPPKRTVPAAEDWTEWHHYPEDGEW